MVWEQLTCTMVTVAPVWAEPVLLGALTLPLRFWSVWESRKDGVAPFWESKKPTASEVWQKDKCVDRFWQPALGIGSVILGEIKIQMSHSQKRCVGELERDGKKFWALWCSKHGIFGH